ARVVTALPAGTVTDRLGPRAVMIGSDVLRAAAVVGLAVSLGEYRSPVGFLVAAAVLGAGAGCFQPAGQALTPTLVSDEELPGANATIISVTLVANALAPALGGLGVVALSPATMLLIDGATFCTSVITLSLIRGGRGAAVRKTEPVESERVRTVWQFFRSSPRFRVILLMMAVFGLAIAGTLEVALPLLSRQRPALGVTGYGLLMSALGAGWLIGALASRRASRLPRQGWLVIGLLAAEGLLLAVLPWSPGLIAMLAVMLLVGVCDGSLVVIVLTVLQRMPPTHLRGRVLGLLASVNFAMYPIAAAVTGAFVAHTGAGVFFVATGAGVCVVALIGAASASVREVRADHGRS
ncbi:MAG: MFS transporter, partial [Nocardioidaceae bacterium]